MNKHKIFQHFLFSLALISFFSFHYSCKKPDNPQPVEQELITTIELLIGDSAHVQSYKYYVEGGTNGSGIVTVDSIFLNSGQAYPVSIKVLNEQAQPIEDITPEILEENEDHLFIWSSTPPNGAGSLIFSGGNLDSAQKPLNQAGILTSGASGNGTLHITLMHKPNNKNASNPAEAGGSTDAVAKFPVFIMP